MIADGQPYQVVDVPGQFHLDVMSLPRNSLNCPECTQKFVEDFINAPFDLVGGALFRTKLIRHSTCDHILLFSAHHLIIDAFSIGVLANELSKFMFRFEHSAVPMILAAVFIDSVGFGIVMPAFPELITHLGQVDLEAATRIASWMLVVFALGQFFASPVLGNLGDSLGRRPVLMLTMFAFSADYGMMAVAPSLPWLFAGRTIAGIAGAGLGPASAVLADITPPDKRGATFGLTGAAFGVGFILGPALGGSLRVPFIVAAGLAALNAVAMLLLLPETLKPENRRAFRLRNAHVIGSFHPLFQVGNVSSLLLACFLWQLNAMVFPAIWSFWAAIQLNWDARAIGWSLAFVGFTNVVVQVFLTGRTIRAFGERRAAIVGMGCSVATLFLCAFTTESWQIYALLLAGAPGVFTYPALNAILSRRVDAGHQGALQGGIASMSSIAAIIAPIIAAQVLAASAAQGFAGMVFLVASGFIGAALVIIMLWVPQVTSDHVQQDRT